MSINSLSAIIIGMKKHILGSVEDAIRAAGFLKEPESLQFIENAARAIAGCFRKGRKLLIAGNGGSLCDAMHFAEEFTGIFRGKRAALPALALSDPGHLSCTANDLGYQDVFSRAVEAFGKENDILISLTTSGNSMNLINAVLCAKQKKMKTISFLGKTGGKLKGMSDLEWKVDGFTFSDRIQEAHMAAIHIIIEMVEKDLFYDL
ncbi:MAG TPA: SIS domain-containing protein [Rhabdochlamydiaceae bacterium]|nr:SIS domain-containing protein [Rhabdochlamydiaceae bacterium]